MTTFEKLNRALISNLENAGIYEHCTHYLLSSHLNSGSRIIDLGANVGKFYSLMHHKYHCTCYAVEASLQLFARLPPFPKVVAYNYAIGPYNGEAAFYISEESEANSLRPAIASAFGIQDTIAVPMVTFEKFLLDQDIQLPLDLLKIDIEGAEIDVINTLPESMLSKISQIPVEFHDFLGLGDEYINEMRKAIAKLKANHFKIIRISEYDYHAVLCINRRLISLSPGQKIRLNIIHPLILNLKLTHSKLSRLLNGAK